MRTYASMLKAFIRFLVAYEYIEKDFSARITMPEVPDKIPKYISETDALRAIYKGTEPRNNDNSLAKKIKERVSDGITFHSLYWASQLRVTQTYGRRF